MHEWMLELVSLVKNTERFMVGPAGAFSTLQNAHDFLKQPKKSIQKN